MHIYFMVCILHLLEIYTSDVSASSHFAVNCLVRNLSAGNQDFGSGFPSFLKVIKGSEKFVDILEVLKILENSAGDRKSMKVLEFVSGKLSFKKLFHFQVTGCC